MLPHRRVLSGSGHRSFDRPDVDGLACVAARKGGGPFLLEVFNVMRHTISFISLPVADVARSRRFYEAMGLEASSRSRPEAAFFQMNGLVLATADRKTMDDGLGVSMGGSKSKRISSTRVDGVVLSHNVRREEEVDELLARAKAAGGRIEKSAGPAPWGGRTGCFADPDGHLWEVVFNDAMPMDAMGNVFLEPPGVW